MKKTIIALIAVLALVVAAPAMAAEINSAARWKPASTSAKQADEPWTNWGIEADNGLSMKLDVNAGEKIRVGLEFGTTEVGLDEDGELEEGHHDPTGDEPAELDITLQKAYLETTGAFWHGGLNWLPPLVTSR